MEMEAAMTQMQMMTNPHAAALLPGSRMQTIARLARRRHARISGGGSGYLVEEGRRL